jgi:hypothetical protein
MSDPVRKFTFDGTTYAMVERPLFPEIDWVERAAGTAIEDMTSSAQTRALMLISLRRAQMLLTWEDFETLSPRDFQMLKPDPLVEEPADPQAAGVEVGSEASPVPEPEASTGPSPSSPTSTGSTSSATFI